MNPIHEYLLIGGGIAVGVIILLSLIARMYRKVGPNQALIIYGMGGSRVVTGSGALIVPMFQTCRELSLELMSFDVAPQNELYTHQGVSVLIDAVTQLKVKSDLENVKTAAEQFLDKTPEMRESAIRLVMEGHLRGIVGQLTVEEIVKEPEMVGEKVRSTCAGDLSKMGLEMVSFTIKQVRDQNEYIKNMGIPDVERVKKEANIASAEAFRDTEIRRSQALREAAVAKAQADQERVIAETASMAKQSEAQRDLEIKKAQYTETVQRQRAQSDKAYEIQTNTMQQQVIAEKIKVDQVERQALIAVQESEILRREKELVATELKPAEVEAKRIQTLAEAEKGRLRLEAEGRGEALKKQGEAEATVLKTKGEAEAAVHKTKGEAEAQVIKTKGEAEAQIIRAKGEAEAAAMDVKAKAYRGYNEAAVLDKLLTGLPEVVKAIAQPLSQVDKITIISTGGDGDGNGAAGAHKITGDITRMVAQVPALIESLSGISVGELMRNLPRLGPAIKAAEKTAAAEAEARVDARLPTAKPPV
jgi:flotillin